MKMLLTLVVVSTVSMALGRMFVGAPGPAEAGGNPLPPCQDINGDGRSDVSDGIYFLQWLYLGGPAPTCEPTRTPGGLPDTGQRWCLDIDDFGLCRPEGQDGEYSTGCPPDGRFTDNGDRTVTDNCTGLQWEKSSWASKPNWWDALVGQEDGWRLPNVRELQSLVDYGRANPALDPVFAASVESTWYWSSTSVVEDPAYAWGVDLANGNIAAGYKSFLAAVILVRDAR